MLVQLFRKEKESIDDLMLQSCCLVVDVCTEGSDKMVMLVCNETIQHSNSASNCQLEFVRKYDRNIFINDNKQRCTVFSKVNILLDQPKIEIFKKGLKCRHITHILKACNV